MRLARAGACLVLALAGVLGAPVVASATPTAVPTDGGIEVSPDGRTWSDVLAGNLLAGSAGVVPGDVASGELWVRNGGDVEARVRVSVRPGVGDGSASLAGALRVEVDGEPVAGGATWRGPVLAPGDSIRIPLAVTFDAAARTGAVQVAQVLDTVTLVEAAADPEPEPDPDDDYAFTGGDDEDGPPGPDGGLAHTGSGVAPLVATALASLLVGWLLVARRRAGRP